MNAVPAAASAYRDTSLHRSFAAVVLATVVAVVSAQLTIVAVVGEAVISVDRTVNHHLQNG